MRIKQSSGCLNTFRLVVFVRMIRLHSVVVPRTAVLVCLHAAACSGPNSSPSKATPPSETEITTYLEVRAQGLYPRLDGLQLAGLRFNDDHTLVCGLVERPGREPVIFLSPDDSPQTLDRPIAIPELNPATAREQMIADRQASMYGDVCARNGLTPIT